MSVNQSARTFTATWNQVTIGCTSQPEATGDNDIVRYELQLAEPPLSGGNPSDIGFGTSTTFGPLDPGTQHYTRNRACFASGCGAWSPWSDVVTINALGTVSINYGPADSYNPGSGNCWNGPSIIASGGTPSQGCYFISITLAGWSGTHTVRCFSTMNDHMYDQFAEFTAGNGTYNACSYSQAGRHVIVVVDGSLQGATNGSTYVEPARGVIQPAGALAHQLETGESGGALPLSSPAQIRTFASSSMQRNETMVKKQTRVREIEAYGERGVAIFDQIEIKLRSLVDEAASVEYNGARARAFKETCSQNAVEFGDVCSSNLQQMALAVQEASSFIAQNLGGRQIQLEPPTIKIEAPAIIVDEELETADSSILTTLQQNCNTIYGEIFELYGEHLDAFTGLGATEAWVGPEYDDARGQIVKLTGAATDGVEASRKMMDEAITNQMADLNM